LQVTETILSALDWKPQIVTDPKAFAGTAKKTLDLSRLKAGRAASVRDTSEVHSLEQLRKFVSDHS
jgi:hypothetical protein